MPRIFIATVDGGDGSAPMSDCIRRASADVTFSVVSSSLGEQPLDVTIDLSLDERTDDPTLPEPPIGQWTSGAIQVEVPDGSRVRAEPIPGNPGTLRIRIGDDSFERAWDDGFQVECHASDNFGCG